MFKVTVHAQQQMARRAISFEDLNFVLDHGVYGHQREGRIFYYCGRKSPQARNIGVILGADGAVITVIKSPNLKRLRNHISKREARCVELWEALHQQWFGLG